ncbi:MAG: type VI secretion system tube protein Hcp [Hyphomicrobiales bacterium]|nr:type VI secretion system tube protein Hcp [Hyphomicrobiales bacterium]
MGIYLRFDKGSDIKGDSTQQGFKGEDGWMNLNSFSWGLKRTFAKDQVGRALNREAAQAHVTEVTVSKDVDASSGALLEAATIDFKGKECEIAFLRTGNPGEKYLHFTLKNTLIKNLKVSGQGDQRPKEDLLLDFTYVDIEVKTLEEANVDGATMHITYDIATGEGS